LQRGKRWLTPHNIDELPQNAEKFCRLIFVGLRFGMYSVISFNVAEGNSYS